MAKFYPNHSPYSAGTQNYLWISIEPRILKYSDLKKNLSVGSEPSGDERMLFLAPNELQDNIVHNWSPMENILSRVQEKAAQAERELAMATQQHKVDTALLYQDSNRRNIPITVNLAAYDNVQENVFEPIHSLRKYSSPELHEKSATQTKVGNPYVFRVNTVLGTGQVIPLINIKNAALNNVNPTFQGPYKDGYPSFAELTLEFTDMSPLSKKTFEDIESRVSVG